jgi:hypothetical protein
MFDPDVDVASSFVDEYQMPFEIFALGSIVGY